MGLDLPDLKFPMKHYSALHVPHDLQVFLYPGACELKERELHRCLTAGALGMPEIGRLELVERLHEFLLATVVGGLSVRTFNAHYKSLKVFISYVDVVARPLNIQSVESLFVAWANDVSQQLQRKVIGNDTASYWTAKVAKSLEGILNIPSRVLLEKTRLGKTKGSYPGFSVSAKYKTFEETRDFVSDLLDLINILSWEKFPVPLPLRLTTELSDKVEFYRGGNGRNEILDKIDEVGWIQATTAGNLQSDRSIMNLRLFCELHYFIFYTGANLCDITKLEFASVQGWVDENGRRFRIYKNRKGGDVCYKIYEKFVEHYELYVRFRAMVVSRRPSLLLFPFIKEDCEHQSDEFQASPLRFLLRNLGRPYISPGKIRNYLLNDVFEFTGNVALAAGAGQHSTKTFIRSYMQPNLHVAAGQWTKFFAKVDGSLRSVAPGGCNSSQPKKIPELQHLGAEPNCSNSAGCLFCEQYRGLLSFDYIWSLLSYRKIKDSEGFVEGNGGTVGALSSVQAVIFRIDLIIEEFRSQNETAEQFYQDALSRCVSDDHHPAWAGYLELMDLI